MRRTLRTAPPSGPRWPGRIAVGLIAVVALLGAVAGRPPQAAAAPPPPVSAKAYVIMDQQTGVVLASQNADERLPMASTTKIMTGLLVLERFRNFDTVVRARRDAVGVGQDEIYLQVGEKLTVYQLLEALLIQSANDAAADLADAVSGSQPAFVALMNAKARELGLTNTHYENPHGLDQRGHYTSALDLTRLARVAMSDPRFAGFVDHYTATIPWAHHPYDRVLVSHNELLEHYQWVYGVKTGWTDRAGYCIVAAGHVRGHDIFVTLLGEPDDAHRVADALKLFRWSASQYRERDAWPSGTVFARVAVPWHAGKLDLVAGAPIRASLRIGATVTTKVEAPAHVSLPVMRGQPLGTVRAFADGRSIGSEHLVAAASYGRVGLLGKVGYELHSAVHWLAARL
jgi:D-alanyl-D-alanine carboxypeptidase (penicillin-binding protein 5/6)